MIKFENVSFKNVNGKNIFKNFSIQVDRGGTLVIRGNAGSGKTLLIEMMGLVRHVSEGKIQILGHDTSKLSRKEICNLHRRIGVIFQDLKLLENLNVSENIALPLVIIGTPRKEIHSALHELLPWIGLGELSEAKISDLSWSEQRALALARAVISRPRLIVADNPFLGVDKLIEDRMIHLLKALNKLGTTVVVASNSENLDLKLDAERLNLS